MIDGENVYLRGFGSFEVKTRARKASLEIEKIMKEFCKISLAEVAKK